MYVHVKNNHTMCAVSTTRWWPSANFLLVEEKNIIAVCDVIDEGLTKTLRVE